MYFFITKFYWVWLGQNELPSVQPLRWCALHLRPVGCWCPSSILAVAEQCWCWLAPQPPHPHSWSLGVGRRWGGGTVRTADVNINPYHTLLCLAIDARGKEEEGGTGCLWLWCLPSQATATRAKALCARKWRDICLLVGRSKFCFPC